MANVKLDTVGLRCPQPVVQVVAKMPSLKKGDVLEVSGDCATFEEDMRKWCQRSGKTFLAVNQEGDVKIISIQF